MQLVGSHGAAPQGLQLQARARPGREVGGIFSPCATHGAARRVFTHHTLGFTCNYTTTSVTKRIHPPGRSLQAGAHVKAGARPTLTDRPRVSQSHPVLLVTGQSRLCRPRMWPESPPVYMLNCGHISMLSSPQGHTKRRHFTRRGCSHGFSRC